jgi:hypothetical protein
MNITWNHKQVGVAGARAGKSKEISRCKVAMQFVGPDVLGREVWMKLYGPVTLSEYSLIVAS